MELGNSAQSRSWGSQALLHVEAINQIVEVEYDMFLIDVVGCNGAALYFTFLSAGRCP